MVGAKKGRSQKDATFLNGVRNLERGSGGVSSEVDKKDRKKRHKRDDESVSLRSGKRCAEKILGNSQKLDMRKGRTES